MRRDYNTLWTIVSAILIWGTFALPKGVASDATGCLDQVRKALIESEMKDGRDEDVRRALSIAYARAGDDATASKFIENMQSLRQQIMGLAQLSCAYSERGKDARAAELLNQALENASIVTKLAAEDVWQEIALALVRRGDLDAAIAAVKDHNLHRGMDRRFYLRRFLDVYCQRAGSAGLVAVVERILGKPLQRADLDIMPVVAEVAMKFESQELAAEVAARAAEAIDAKTDAFDQFIDNILAARCFQIGRLPDKALRHVQEAERLVKLIKLSGDGLEAGLLAEEFAAVGEKDLANAQVNLVPNEQWKGDVLARVPVGLARSGRIEEAAALFLEMCANGKLRKVDTTPVFWEIASIAADARKPQIAAGMLSGMKASQMTYGTVSTSDCDGRAERAEIQGIRGVCGALAAQGKSDEAMRFITEAEHVTGLSARHKALGMIWTAESVTRAGK